MPHATNPDSSPEIGLRQKTLLSLFGLASGGVYPAIAVTGNAVGSYPTLSPLPVNRRFAFCGTFPGVAPAGHYPAPYFREARTFLTNRLSAYDWRGCPAD